MIRQFNLLCLSTLIFFAFILFLTFTTDRGLDHLQNNFDPLLVVLCGIRFVSKTSRYWHKLQHSLETKCFYCDFVADNLKAFQNHAKEVHGKQDEDMGNDKVKCMYCEKILTKGAIYSHRQFHITQPVQCKICYVTAKSKHSLYYHVRELHKSDLEKSFLEKGCPSNMLTVPCEKCDLKFLKEKL